jgi:hypothetical protein
MRSRKTTAPEPPESEPVTAAAPPQEPAPETVGQVIDWLGAHPEGETVASAIRHATKALVIFATPDKHMPGGTIMTLVPAGDVSILELAGLLGWAERNVYSERSQERALHAALLRRASDR